jgi:hypothetical protein
MDVSPLVLAEVRRIFPGDQADSAIELLRRTAIPGLNQPGRESDRVHLAVLVLAGADLTKLRSALDLAASDWRDVLMAAGLASENWPDVLRDKGYAVPAST